MVFIISNCQAATKHNIPFTHTFFSRRPFSLITHNAFKTTTMETNRKPKTCPKLLLSWIRKIFYTIPNCIMHHILIYDE